jgi:hypothetical protein
MKPMLRSLLLFAVLGAAAVTASAADISGTWDVDGSVQGNPVVFPCSIKQDGVNLTGTAKIQDVDKPVTGRVEANSVTFKFEVEYNGSPLEMAFTGTLNSDKDMSGTFAVAGASGEFKAKKQ